MLVLIIVWHDWSIVTAAKTKCPINLQSQSVAQQYLFFHSAESLFTSLTHCNVLLGVQLPKNYSRLTWLISEITVTSTRAKAFLSILGWSGSVGLSMNLRIVLVFIGVIADYNKPPDLAWLGEVCCLWHSEWYKGCPVSTSCGSAAITKPHGIRLLFEHILDPDLMPICKTKDVLSPKSNLDDEFVWQLSAVLPSPGDNKSCLVNPQSVSSEIMKPLPKIHL